MKINLGDYCHNGNYELVTRTQGIVVRTSEVIDAHIDAGGSIEFIIPKEIFSLGQCFLEELLENSIAKLGREGFSQRIKFTSKGRYRVDLDLNEVMSRVLGDYCYHPSRLSSSLQV